MKYQLVWTPEYGKRILDWSPPAKGEVAGYLTPRELANFLDTKAENANRHHVVGTHILLAGYLHGMLGEELAARVMRGIAERGGLHECDIS